MYNQSQMPDIFVSKKTDTKKSASKKTASKKTEEKSAEKPINKTGTKFKKKFHKPPFSNILEKEKTLGSKAHLKKPLSAFSFYPDGIDFETRESEEEVILFLRQHAIVNIPWILVAFLMILAPFFVSSLPLFELIPANFKFIFVLVWYLVTTAFVLEKFLTWFFNVYIVTDERIVDIDFYNLIYKEVSDAKIDNIQDVTYNMGGVIRTLFNYGNVFVQTASEVPNFEFLAVPKPDKAVRVLLDLQIQEEQEKLEGRVR